MSGNSTTPRSTLGTNDRVRDPESRELSSPISYVPVKKRSNADKHRKVLAHGKQIKTHLLCQHVESKPIWGAGLSVKESDSQLLLKRKVIRQRAIDQKIDRLSLPENRRTSVRKNGAKNSLRNIPAKHRKILSGGQQLKTHLICEHLKQSPAHIGQKRSYDVKDGYSSRRDTSSFDSGTDSSDDIPISQKPVLKKLSSSTSCDRFKTGRRIFAPVGSPDDVPIVDVRVPPITNPLPRYQIDSSLPNDDGHSKPRFSRKRICFEDETPQNFEYCYEDVNEFSESPHSEFNVDRRRRRCSVGKCCSLCDKKFESVETRPGYDVGDACQFCGSCFTNLEGFRGCEYCSCYHDNGRCWAVQAFENPSSDGSIGMAHCMHHAHQEKYGKKMCHRRPNLSPVNDSENIPPAYSAANLKSSSKHQAKRLNEMHVPPKAFDHQCLHQYHQNSRLFLEPTFPDDRGRSRCEMCGLPSEGDSCANGNDSDGPSHRSRRKVTFDLPRRLSTSRSTAEQDRHATEVETRKNALRSALNSSVSMESGGVSGCRPLRKFSNIEDTSVLESQFASWNAHRFDRSRSTSGGSCQSTYGLVKNSRNPLFMLSVDPLLKERAYGSNNVSIITSKSTLLSSAKKERVSISSTVPKRNPGRSMALEDHI